MKLKLAYTVLSLLWLIFFFFIALFFFFIIAISNKLFPLLSAYS
jgi:hypothetical protein